MNANQATPSACRTLKDTSRFTVFPDDRQPILLPALAGLLKAEPRLLMELTFHASIAIAIQVLSFAMN